MIELRTLGELSVRVDGRHVRLGTRKQQALLVYLAVHPGRSFRREQLIALLWEDAPAARGRHSLSQTLYGLRRRLPELPIRVAGEELWPEQGAIGADVLTFRGAVMADEFAAAAACYRGEFLDGFWLSGAPAWQEWQEDQRDELNRLARQVFRHLLTDAEARGDWLEVERIGSRLLEFDPFDEGVHRARLAAIAASGGAVRAIAEYHELETLLARELGRAPGAETVELGQRLVAPASALPAAPEEARVDDGFATSFVGRVGQFQSLRDDWHSLCAGQGRTVIGSGEAGIGKTRFCRHFLRWAVLQGARILRGRCYATERQLPYSGVVDALLSGVRPGDLDGLSPAWSAVVAELLPEFRPELADRSIGSLEGEGARRRLFEGIAQLLMKLAQRGSIILFIDDLHWADDSTVALIHYLARRLNAAPVLILLALRNEDVEADSELADLLSRRTSQAWVRSMSLPELDQASVAELIDSYEHRVEVRIPDPTREWIGSTVGGRPFLIIEMLKALGDGRRAPVESGWPADAAIGPETFVPESVEEFLNSRCRGLGRDATEVMSSIAVLGKEASLEVVEGVSGLTGRDLARALEELARKGIIDDGPRHLSFSHDLLREAAHRGLSSARRRILHGRAADVLERIGNAPPGTLASHYDLFGKRDRAYRYAMEAATASERVFARKEAESFLLLALSNATGPEETITVQERIARLLYHRGHYVEAEAYYSVLHDHYRQTADVAGQLSAELNHNTVQRITGSLPMYELLPRLERLWNTAENLGDTQMISEVLRAIVNVAHDIGNREAVIRVAAKTLRAAKEFERTAEGARTLAGAAMVVAIYQSLTQGLNHAEQVLQLARATGDPWTMLTALSCYGKVSLKIGRLDTAERNLVAALDIAERVANDRGTEDAQIALILLWTTAVRLT